MEGNFTKISRKNEPNRPQPTALGRLETIIKLVFQYVILPFLVWDLALRCYYKIIVGVFDMIFKILLLFFVSESGGLFNGISEDDEWYGVNSAGGADVDEIFDEVLREEKANVGKKPDTFMKRINSRYRWVMEGIESQQIWQSTWENVEELYFIFDKADYVFDRYVKHSPFCVLNKINPRGKKSHYEYDGIPLSKFEGFGSYLLYKRLGTKTITATRPHLYLKLPVTTTKIQKPVVSKREVPRAEVNTTISRLTQTETIKPAKERTVSVFSPPVFNFASKSFAQSTSNEYKHASPKRIKLDDSRVQTSVIKPTPEKTILSAITNKPRVINIEFPNKQKSGFKLLIRPKHEPSIKKQKLGIEVLSTSNTKRITKSISVDDVEYVEKVKHAIKQVLPKPDYDDGSLGPVILRLAWHCCATYNKFTGNGGSNGSTMRFIPEITDDGNTGLDVARSALEPIKQKYPAITYSDLWTLAGKISIQEMGGPEIPWRCGRVDCIDDRYVPPNGRLPFAYKNANHIRETFGRMGFNDRETVLLLGAHGLGRCHKKFSGWEGKWTQKPTSFSNDFYKVLLDEEWSLGTVPETGKEQYYNKDKSLIMLNTDIELIRDPHFLHFVKLYSQHQATFFQDFANAFGKLLELGIERDSNGNILPKTEFY